MYFYRVERHLRTDKLQKKKKKAQKYPFICPLSYAYSLSGTRGISINTDVNGGLLFILSLLYMWLFYSSSSLREDTNTTVRRHRSAAEVHK